MKRLAITRIALEKKDHIAYIVLDENRNFIDFQLFEPENSSCLEQIYVGRVDRVMENIQAAFVTIGNGRKCYLPLEESSHLIYTKKNSSGQKLCGGDEILIQIVKDAVKTKDAVCSASLSLAGSYCVLTTKNQSLSVSRKLPEEKRTALEVLLQELCPEHQEEGYGVVIRTNGASVDEQVLRQDILDIRRQFLELKNQSVHLKPPCMIYENPPGYVRRLQSANMQEYDYVITDCQDIFNAIQKILPHLVTLDKIKFHQDDAVSLSTLYNIRWNLSQLLSNKVWLPSGANIIIESLETLTVIDVNSGKNQSRKKDTLFQVNLEAAKEIARQLRLRNISGMIIVDFINLSDEESKQKLIHTMKRLIKEDPVPCNFIDITKLGLMELTRKKTHKSLIEIVRKS